MMFRLRRRTRVVIAALACAVGAAVLLPESANPRAAAQGFAAAPITVTKSAPPNATVGELMDYTISLAYTGELTAPTPPITVTDALPQQVVFRGWGISPAGVCPTAPAQGQGGTVQCTVEFTPTRKTISLTIRVQLVAAGTVTNLVQLSTGESGSATTTVGPAPNPPPAPGEPIPARPAPAGSVTVTVDGPASVVLPASTSTRAELYRYTIAVTYNGTLTGLSDLVYVEVTDELPEQVLSRGWGVSVDSSGECPTRPVSGPGTSGGTYVCRLNYHSTQPRTNVLFFEVRPFATGLATNTVRLSTGETVATTTVITRATAPDPQPPAPLPGPAAAPPKTVVETFTQPGEVEPQSAPIAPTAKTAQVALTWPDADSSFDATGFRIVRDGQVVARAPSSVSAKVRPKKLVVSKRRRARSLDVRIKGVTRGKLVFKIVARRLDGRTRVVAKVRQSKRG